jgi:hypothetical protein
MGSEGTDRHGKKATAGSQGEKQISHSACIVEASKP